MAIFNSKLLVLFVYQRVIMTNMVNGCMDGWKGQIKHVYPWMYRLVNGCMDQG